MQQAKADAVAPGAYLLQLQLTHTCCSCSWRMPVAVAAGALHLCPVTGGQQPRDLGCEGRQPAEFYWKLAAIPVCPGPG